MMTLDEARHKLSRHIGGYSDDATADLKAQRRKCVAPGCHCHQAGNSADGKTALDHRSPPQLLTSEKSMLRLDVSLEARLLARLLLGGRVCRETKRTRR